MAQGVWPLARRERRAYPASVLQQKPLRIFAKRQESDNHSAIFLKHHMTTMPTIPPKGIPAQAESKIPVATAAEPQSLIAWREAITQAWSRAADNTLQLARLMSRARACIPHGQWGQLWQSGMLPFSQRKGEMLIIIGKELGGLNSQNSANLPVAWNTLYYLARLGQPLVEQLITEREIHPDLSLRDALELLAKHRPGSQRRKRGSRIKGRLARLAALIDAESGSWAEGERRFVHQALLALAGEVCREQATQQSFRRVLEISDETTQTSLN
jgi:hypothetical protein